VDEQTQTVESPVDEQGSSSTDSLIPKETASAMAEKEVLKDIDQLLVKRVLQLAVELETQARVLLMHTMPKGSRSEVLLRADMVRQMKFGDAPLLILMTSFYSGFRIAKSRNCIWKTLIQSCDPKDLSTSMRQRVGSLMLTSGSGDIGSFLLRC
jgi:hypothetical protein